jgi:histidinol-phosphate aminotransferase
MYTVSAQVNDVSLLKVPLTPAPEFTLDVLTIKSALSSDPHIKLIYVCSPGNPTGGLIPKSQLQEILEHPTWNGIVVLDEAYIDFAPDGSSLAEWVTEWPNLVVMQTLSKAFGLAGIRLGAAFAAPPVAALLNNLKAPYNVSSPTSAIAYQALQKEGLAVMQVNRKKILVQRERLLKDLPKVKGIGRFRGGTTSNFLLVEILNKSGRPDNATALAVYERLAEEKGVVVRFRGKEHGCLGCLRITVGTEEEVTRFMDAIGKAIDEIHGNTPEAIPNGILEEKKEAQASQVIP